MPVTTFRLLLALAAVSAFSPVAARRAPTVPPPPRLPFSVGEKLTYQAKVNFVKAGSATMTVEGIETVRGHPAYHTIFDVRGRVVFYRVNDHYESWFDTTTLSSLKMVQHIEQGDHAEDRNYDFYPERRVYVRDG